jgi:hypothetical protein
MTLIRVEGLRKVSMPDNTSSLEASHRAMVVNLPFKSHWVEGQDGSYDVDVKFLLRRN